jgi:hypothetical protein
MNNQFLTFLDLSFNPLGENKKPPKRKPNSDEYLNDPNFISPPPFLKRNQSQYNISGSMSKMFFENKTLMHADFSHCGFNTYECEEIGEGLKNNHTLLGLHFTGNSMNTDALGYLKPINIDMALTHLSSEINFGMHSGRTSTQKIKMQSSSNCWVCEGWTRIKFSLNPKHVNNPPKHDLTEKDKVYLNLSIDGHEPDAMTLDPDTGTYSVDRMVPSIELEYFFTINGSQKYHVTNDKKAPSNIEQSKEHSKNIT